MQRRVNGDEDTPPRQDNYFWPYFVFSGEEESSLQTRHVLSSTRTDVIRRRQPPTLRAGENHSSWNSPLRQMHRISQYYRFHRMLFWSSGNVPVYQQVLSTAILRNSVVSNIPSAPLLRASGRGHDSNQRNHSALRRLVARNSSSSRSRNAFTLIPILLDRLFQILHGRCTTKRKSCHFTGTTDGNRFLSVQSLRATHLNGIACFGFLIQSERRTSSLRNLFSSLSTVKSRGAIQYLCSCVDYSCSQRCSHSDQFRDHMENVRTQIDIYLLEDELVFSSST